MIRKLLFVILFISSSIFSFNSVLAVQLKILDVEQLPCFGGARLNVLLDGIVPNMGNLRYSYKAYGESSWSSEQNSSSFSFSENDLTNINDRTLSFRVRYRNNYHDYDVMDGINIIDKRIAVDVSYTPQNPNCGEVNGGGVNASITGGWRYLIFDGTQNTEVQIPAGFLNHLNAFTIEGDIKLNKDISTMTKTDFIGTFGIDNILEFGFRKGKPGGYISFLKSDGKRGAFNLISNYKFPNDKQWHNMVLRSDGRTMEILIDGNVYASQSKEYVRLVSDNGKLSFVTIGANVWNTKDKGLNGAVSRVSFWDRKLSNNELKDLRSNPPKGEELGLLAAYNFDVKVDKKLLPTLPASTANPGNYVGNIIGAKWSDKITYTLNKLTTSGTFVYFTEGESSEAVIGNLTDGIYQFIATYDSGDGTVISSPYEFTIQSSSDLSARISYKVDHDLCEGDEIILKVDEVIGGAREGEPTYKWMVLEDGIYKKLPGGNVKFPKTNVEAGVNSYKLLISSGTCIDHPVLLDVTSSPKIRTQAIVRM